MLVFAGLAELVYRRYRQVAASGGRLPAADAIQPLAFALASALVGTQAVVQAKCAAEAVKLIAVGCVVQVLESWYLYITIVLLASCGALWLYRLNLALATYDPLFIIPLLQSQYIVCATLSGGIYFQEFAGMDTKAACLFVLGIVTLLSGLSLMMPEKAAQMAGDSDGDARRRNLVLSHESQAAARNAPSSVNSYRIDVETGQMMLVGRGGQPTPPAQPRCATTAADGDDVGGGGCGRGGASASAKSLTELSSRSEHDDDAPAASDGDVLAALPPGEPLTRQRQESAAAKPHFAQMHSGRL